LPSNLHCRLILVSSAPSDILLMWISTISNPSSF
jgi:hypothetical protein